MKDIQLTLEAIATGVHGAHPGASVTYDPIFPAAGRAWWVTFDTQSHRPDDRWRGELSLEWIPSIGKIGLHLPRRPEEITPFDRPDRLFAPDDAGGILGAVLTALG